MLKRKDITNTEVIGQVNDAFLVATVVGVEAGGRAPFVRLSTIGSLRVWLGLHASTDPEGQQEAGRREKKNVGANMMSRGDIGVLG